MFAFSVVLFIFGIVCIILGLIPDKSNIKKISKQNKPTNVKEILEKSNSTTINEENKSFVKISSSRKFIVPETSTTWNKEYAYIYSWVDIFVMDDTKLDFKTLNFNDPLIFKPEPTNTYDPKAIIVMQNDKHLGYLYKGKFQDMANDYIRDGLKISGELASYNIEENKIYIDLLFGWRRPPQLFFSKLTGNTSEEFQNNITCVDEDTPISIEYDLATEKYWVSNFHCGKH